MIPTPPLTLIEILRDRPPSTSARDAVVATADAAGWRKNLNISQYLCLTSNHKK